MSQNNHSKKVGNAIDGVHHSVIAYRQLPVIDGAINGVMVQVDASLRLPPGWQVDILITS